MNFLRKLRALFRKEKLDAEMSEEMRAHLELQAAENERRGMSPDDARYAARRDFGGVEQIKERARDVLGITWIDWLVQDVRYGARQLRKNLGFTVIVVATLAIAIGANTAVFSVLDAVFLRSLPVKNPAELVFLTWTSDGRLTPSGGGGSQRFDPATAGLIGGTSFSFRAFEQFCAQGELFSDLFAFGRFGLSYMVVDGQSEDTDWQYVSGGFHQGFGVRAVVGRTLLPSDDRADAPPVAVISYRYWQRRFGGDPAAVGKTVFLYNAPVTIVGVTPPDFIGVGIGQEEDYTIPLAMVARLDSSPVWRDASNSWLTVVARPKTGIKPQEAVDSLQGGFTGTIEEAWMQQPSNKPKTTPRLGFESARQGVTRAKEDSARRLWMLAGLVGLVLLMACTTVANLLLARGTAREKEIAVRLALGASRGRVVRQLLTESALLGAGGAAVGLVFAWWGRDLLLAMRPLGGYPLENVPLDFRALGFAVIVAGLTTIGFGLVPAFRATRRDIRSGFSGGLPKLGEGMRSALRLSGGLVVVQIALSLLLLVTGALFVRTLYELRTADVGFNRRNYLHFGVRMKPPGYQVPQFAARLDDAEQRIRRIPGVQMVTYARLSVLVGAYTPHAVFLASPTPQFTQGARLSRNDVSPGFFAEYGMPILLGRGFTAHDDEHAAKVAVVNQAMVRKYFGGENPLGRRFGETAETASEIEIVGVVRDAKTVEVRQEVEPTVYCPFRQQTSARVYVAVAAAGDPQAIIPELRRAYHDVDPSLMMAQIRTSEDYIEQFTFTERLFAILASFFGLIAVPMSCLGLFGLVSYSTLRRTKEFGIRAALGALPRAIRLMVLRQFLPLVIIGVATGAAASWAASRIIGALMFGVSPTDVTTYALVTLGLTAVALLACWLPARRAAKVDPMVALRCE